MGNGWFGTGWFGNGWFGSGGVDGGTGGGSTPVYNMRADRPLAEVAVAANMNVRFLERQWDPDLLALIIVPEFLRAQVGIGGQMKTFEDALNMPAVLPPPAGPTQAIISDLAIKAVTERPEALGEIVEQNLSFQGDFLQLLNISHTSHPKTFLLMKLAARVGELAMMLAKRKYPDQARPSQVCPTLFPPVPLPGHSTYTAGHALISWLTTKCLQDIPELSAATYQTSLEALAERVGNNRVFAGLHYLEDVAAGKSLGILLHDYINQCNVYKNQSPGTNPTYKGVLDLAKDEWH
jgi:hypothetical protein